MCRIYSNQVTIYMVTKLVYILAFSVGNGHVILLVYISHTLGCIFPMSPYKYSTCMCYIRTLHGDTVSAT